MPEDPAQPPSKFYVTTPIYYVNARPHIGHAYTTIVADVLARRHRMLGDDTFFLTGTDEHGQKIERSAAAAGVPPQQFADEVSAQFRALWDRMGLTYDKYIRTTDPAHRLGVQKMFRTLYERGFIYLSTYTGSYCVSDEAFVDLPAGTPCPDCGRLLETVTEENFFFKLSAFGDRLLQLIESNALRITPDTARNEVLSFVRGGLKDLSVSRSSFTWGVPVPEDVERASGTKQHHVIYVWVDALINYISAIGYGADGAEAQELFARYWPADLHLVGKEITRFHCVYWPALLMAAELPTPKQITANGWLLFDNAKMSKSRGNVVRTETILDAFGDHVYGKQFPDSTKRERDLFASDVLRYFVLREIPFGRDGSFSFEALVTRYNADLANGYGNLVSRVLKMVNTYCNGTIPDPDDDLVPGSLDWEWDAPSPVQIHSSEAIRQYSQKAAMTVDLKFESFTFSGGSQEEAVASNWGVLNSIWSLITHTDLFLTQHAPWKLVTSSKSSQGRVEAILLTASRSIRIITLLLHPILPHTTAKVWQQLGLGDIALATSHEPLATLLQWGGLKPGTKLGSLSPIFPRADKSLIQVMQDMEDARNTPTPLPIQEATNIPMVAEASLPAVKAAGLTTERMPTAPDNEPSTHPGAAPRTSSLEAPGGTLPVAGSVAEKPTLPTTPGPHKEAHASGPFQSAAGAQQNGDNPSTINIDDFMKVELRVAQILVAERIPKADNLLRLEVDLGKEKRQILSGIAQHYAPEELVGRRIVVVSNLAPRKMRGLDSHGMLLAASEGPDGKPVLATFGEEVPLGARVR